MYEDSWGSKYLWRKRCLNIFLVYGVLSKIFLRKFFKVGERSFSTLSKRKKAKAWRVGCREQRFEMEARCRLKQQGKEAFANAKWSRVGVRHPVGGNVHGTSPLSYSSQQSQSPSNHEKSITNTQVDGQPTKPLNTQGRKETRKNPETARDRRLRRDNNETQRGLLDTILEK